MTVNITLNIEDYNLVQFENWIRENVDVKDFKIVPNTDDLYESDNVYKSLCKKVSQARRTRDEYYNNKR